MFLTSFPDIHSPKYLQVVRVKSGSSVCGTLCGDPVQAAIHYYRGKSYPCVSSTEARCSLCTKGLSKRLYAWWPIRGKRGQGAVLEMTQTAFLAVREAVDICPADHIILVRLSRAAGRKNAPLTCDTEYRRLSDEEKRHLVRTQIDGDLIKRTLCRLWDLPEWDPGMNEEEFDEITTRYITEMVASEVLK